MKASLNFCSQDEICFDRKQFKMMLWNCKRILDSHPMDRTKQRRASTYSDPALERDGIKILSRLKNTVKQKILLTIFIIFINNILMFLLSKSKTNILYKRNLLKTHSQKLFRFFLQKIFSLIYKNTLWDDTSIRTNKITEMTNLIYQQ